MKDPAVTFSRCVVVRRDLVFISAQLTSLNASGVEHTKVVRWKAGSFAHFMIDWATTALSATTSPLTLLSLGIDGDIHVFQSAQRQVETIAGPAVFGPLRDLRCIAGRHYAVGMRRQVYRRDDAGQWAPLGDVIRDDEGISSFDAIDGYSAEEIYAVGMNGAIWRYDGQAWDAVASPTARALHYIHCSDDGQVYIVGQLGVMLVGRGQHWRRVDLGETCGDLWGVQTFAGAVFVASSSAVYRVTHGQLLAVDIGATGTGAASYLAAGDGVLWSVGRSHLAYTADGERWVSVPYDDTSA